MPSLNKVILIGHLGKDPEARETKTGKKVVNFSVATSYGSGDNQETDWHNIVAWDKQADFVSTYLKKGALVYVEGRSTTATWDKPDGTKGYRTDVIANTVQSLGAKPPGDLLVQGAVAKAKAPTKVDLKDPEIPF